MVGVGQELCKNEHQSRTGSQVFSQSCHSVLTLQRLCLFFEPQFVALQMGTWTTCLQRPQPEKPTAWPWGQFEALTLSYQALYPQAVFIPSPPHPRLWVWLFHDSSVTLSGLVAFGVLQVGRESAFLQRALSLLSRAQFTGPK